MFAVGSRRFGLARRVGVASAVLGIAAAIVPVLGAGPDDEKHRRWPGQPSPLGRDGVSLNIDFGFRRPPAVVGRPIEYRPVYADVTPADLRVTAYQSGETVILVVSGVNHQAGYTTFLSAGDLRGSRPDVVLTNRPGGDFCATAVTPFSITRSFRACERISAVMLHIGGQCFAVPVVQAPCL